METVLIIVCATAFGYGINWLIGRGPLTTADLAVGALAGFAGMGLSRAYMSGGLVGALLVAFALALGLQAFRQRSSLERVE